MYYLNCFLVYSLLGYILETSLALITKSGFKSGIMYGPFTPIYGVGTVIILVLSKYFFINLHMPRWIETVIVFFILSIFLSCLELLGGILIEKIFGIIFWSYKNHKYKIGNYISLEMAFIWGAVSIFFIYVINPLLKRLILKIPYSITYILLFVFILDCITTFIKNK